MCAGADVSAIDRREGRIVEQTQDAARGPGAAVVALSEPRGAALGGGDLERQAEDVEDVGAEGVAAGLEEAELGVVRAEGGGQGLRGALAGVFTYVEGPGGV